MPKSTRANSFMPRFGFANSLIEENAYAPNKQGKTNNNFLSFNKIQSDDKDTLRRQSVSTRANDPIGRIDFPDDLSENENANEISGIMGNN